MLRLRIPAPTRGALAVFALALTLSACDAAGPDAGTSPTGPDTIQPIGADQTAIVEQAFAEVEDLFDLGFDSGAAARGAAGAGKAAGAMASMRAARTDTTTYTGIYDATNTKGYLLTLQYRQPQGVGVWQARVQHARTVDHDNDASTVALDAVETATLTFLDYPSLETFVAALEAGTVPYLAGTSSNAEASFQGYDTWRVAQVFSALEGEAIVSYANAELRESVTVREPVVTRNADGTGTVRDGGPDGSVRTRYFGADFVVSSTGDVTGTLLRTLTSAGDAGDGSVVSRNDYPDNSFRQTRQRGGDGVVVRENTQG